MQTLYIPALWHEILLHFTQCSIKQQINQHTTFTSIVQILPILQTTHYVQTALLLNKLPGVNVIIININETVLFVSI